MFETCTIRGVQFVPARFCAPLAGYTHSAFRRLLAEMGGCGAFWTEMLAAKQILSENFVRSPWLRRRPAEGRLFFQLMTRPDDPLDRILDCLGQNGVQAVDLNLACDALSVRARSSGSALFENREALAKVLAAARRHWPGLLTAKIRLGSRRPDWEAMFIDRLRLLEESGVDAVILHARFFEDKFRRRARHELIPWAATLTRLPIIANGDITAPEQVKSLADHLQAACAIMIGRMAVAQPWLFAAWTQPCAVDYAAIWRRMFEYITEDFETPVALRRIQMFAKYYSVNFQFGHQFYCNVSNATSLPAIAKTAEEFFARNPAISSRPSVAGL